MKNTDLEILPPPHYIIQSKSDSLLSRIIYCIFSTDIIIPVAQSIILMAHSIFPASPSIFPVAQSILPSAQSIFPAAQPLLPVAQSIFPIAPCIITALSPFYGLQHRISQINNKFLLNLNFINDANQTN